MSVFTNVPLSLTVNIVLDGIFNDKLINATLSKRTLKKLILICCSKTIFSFDDQLCEQTDGVSMGSSLGLVLTNIVLTELEKIVVSDLIRCDTKKFYKRYVDNTLLLIKPLDIPTVLAKLNEFDKNLKLTADTFPDGVIHFLGIKVSVDGTDVCRKDTHTGHYTSFSSFEPVSRRTVWIKSLFYHTFKICSTKKLFENHISTIKSFMSWNCYPNSIKKLFN